MKRTKWILLIICLVISMMAFMTGCQTEGPGTLDEPEITVAYLENEYARQLIRDGARVLFGAIDLIRIGDEEIIVIIHEMEIVSDPDYPGGYYVADKNLESEYLLSLGVRATFLVYGEGAKAMEHDEFIDVVWQDFFDVMAEEPEYQVHRLYDIYVLDGYVELLIARPLP